MDHFTLHTILACPACRFGDSVVADAANFAIGFMIIVVFAVLGAFIALILKFARGEREALAEDQQRHSFTGSR